jgi:drug/metabolite transporter (DMT)-like permease
VWCLFAGTCYGIQNIFAKLAYEKGLAVNRFIFIRFAVMFICSFTFGKLRGISFDLRQYDRKIIGVIFFRSSLSLISKSCQYAAISYIPLALSSTISFTTGPIFAAIFAFCLIKEKLSKTEIVTIVLGILGTTMLTMP